MTTEQMDDMDDAARAEAERKAIFEPSAAARQMAKGLHDVYAALVREGFTERQALELVAKALVATIAAQAGNGNG